MYIWGVLMNREYKELVEKYEQEHDFEFQGHKGKHYKIKHKPTGKIVAFSATPSDINAIRQFERDMKRIVNGVW